MSATVPVSVRRIVLRDGTPAWETVAEDRVAAEEPLEIRVEGRSVAVVMRTPGHERELAAGFLLTEGIIRRPADLFEISVCPSVAAGGGSVDAVLTDPSAVDFSTLTRHVFTSSSCGLCGKTSIDGALTQFPPLPRPALRILDAALLFSLPEKLRAAQPAFAVTGGLHGCGLFTAAGDLRALYEDAGRHNALDKLTGRALLDGWLPLTDHILVLSGRVSFELVQKALAARIPVIAAVGAPSSLAVQFAHDAGITLCGFVRETRANIYTHPQRIRMPGES